MEAVARAGQQAALAGAKPALEGMRALTIAECRKDSDDDLVQLSSDLRGLFKADDFRLRVLGVERIDGYHAWITGQLEIHDERYAYVPPYLVMFEDGEWRDAQCKAANDPSWQRPVRIEHD